MRRYFDDMAPPPCDAPNPHGPEHPPADWIGHGDATIRQAVRYWDRLRDGRLAPARNELEPAALLPALHHTAVLERPRPGTIRLRISGGRIAALMGMEARGMPLRALFAVPDRSALMIAAEASFERPAALFASLDAPGEHDTSPLAMALLPLSDSAGQLRHSLLVLGDAEQATSAQTPCRLRLRDHWLSPLRIGRPILTPRRRSGAHALMGADDLRPAQTQSRGPALRVIQGGRRP